MGNSNFSKLFTEGSAFAFVNKQYKYLKRQNVLATLEDVVGKKKPLGFSDLDNSNKFVYTMILTILSNLEELF